jgi:murein DD-endopeptidase MepM/ murein hydrolase activator NlpD
MAYQSSYNSHYRTAPDEYGRRYRDYATNNGVSRSLFVTTLIAAVIFAMWSGATTVYLLFGDDILHRVAVAQSDLGRKQDAQIAALHTEIDKLRSTKFIDQERVDRQFTELTRMQKLIEARHKALSALAQSVTRNNDVTGSIPANAAPVRNAPAPVEQPAPDTKPRPITETFTFRGSLAETTVPSPAAQDKQQRDLAALQKTLKKLNAEQSEALNTLQVELDERTARTKKAIAELGPRLPAAKTKEPVGGPFVPYSGEPQDAFMKQVFRIRLAAEEQLRLSKQVERLPVRLPVDGDIDISSGFGPRVDPFLKRLAMHVGVDIRGDSGDPVRATAAGTVVFAGRHNAYGLMVEIDHGNGLTTRYAHLSAILVKEGAKIPAGTILGKIGSTGRSTAPHLHYEVRIDDSPVDPRRYLRAGRRLAGFE